jgi:CIC family chloride channel protein
VVIRCLSSFLNRHAPSGLSLINGLILFGGAFLILSGRAAGQLPADGEPADLLETLTVSEVMEWEENGLLDSDPVSTAAIRLAEGRHHGLPVLDASGRLVGMFTLQDMDKANRDPHGMDRPIGDFCSRRLVTATPDESVAAALRRMSGRDIGRLPVVDRSDPTHLVGILRRADIIRAYEIALARRAGS